MLKLKKTAYTVIYLAVIMILSSSCCAICPTCCPISSITTHKQESVLVKHTAPDNTQSITSLPFDQEINKVNETD